ncbi:MAG: nitroreductase [Deltaproteobacteria bacterium]|nr:nitroreductase [Deltaproteobacteria bacterium]
MELLEAIRVRKSVRAYKPDPVSLDTLMDLLNAAVRAPSSVNSQPWEFFLVMGEALDALRKAYVEQVRSGIPPHPEVAIPEQKGTAPGLGGVYRDRQVALAKQMFRLLGIGKGEKDKIQAWTESMYRFYDAPAAVVLVTDKSLISGWPLVDTGIMAGTLAYAALEFGLGTCIIRSIVDYPEQLRAVVGIPDSKQIVVGMAIGYPDWNAPVNELNTEREALKNLVTLVDRPKS